MQRYRNPVLDRDFPDPNVIESDGRYYAYATQGLGESPVVNVQLARSDDLVSWDYLGEALPDKPPWAATTQAIWAPHVVENEGRFLMYFSAQPDDPPVPAPPDDPALCLAVAVAEHPTGPFVDVGAPLFCGPSTSDIDPALFRDPANGAWYCYWGSGGDIVVRRMREDLLGFADAENRLLLRGWSAEPKVEYEFGIEGPYVVERDGWYYLWFSGDRTWTYPPHYAAMVARSRSPVGPFERLAEWRDSPTSVVLGDGDRFLGPGHNSVVRDRAGDDWVVYHAVDTRQPYAEGERVRRVMMLDRIDYGNGWPQIPEARPSEAPAPAPCTARSHSCAPRRFSG